MKLFTHIAIIYKAQTYLFKEFMNVVTIYIAVEKLERNQFYN